MERPQGSTVCLAAGGPQAWKVPVDTAEVLIAASVTFRTEPSTSAVPAQNRTEQNRIIYVDTRVNHLSGRIGPSVCEQPGLPR